MKKITECDTVSVASKGGPKKRRGGKNYFLDKDEVEMEVRKWA